MRVVTLGEGSPEVAVVGGIHGDEPCGWKAVEALLADLPDVERPVALVVANERAIEAGVRYVDADLNRSFPPGRDGGEFEYRDDHEGRLARELVDELRGTLVLALHSTQSHPEPFALLADPGPREREVVARLPVEAAVEYGPFAEGRLVAAMQAIEVECGHQGSDRAVETATAVTDAFLRATGVLPDPPESRSIPYFRLTGRIPKAEAGEYEVFAENFREVEAGEAYAATDGRRHYASDSFVPVLLSPEGYEDVFGYAAVPAGTIP